MAGTELRNGSRGPTTSVQIRMTSGKRYTTSVKRLATSVQRPTTSVRRHTTSVRRPVQRLWGQYKDLWHQEKGIRRQYKNLQRQCKGLRRQYKGLVSTKANTVSTKAYDVSTRLTSLIQRPMTFYIWIDRHICQCCMLHEILKSQCQSIMIINTSDHFYSAVSHRQGWAHRALLDQQKYTYETAIIYKYNIVFLA